MNRIIVTAILAALGSVSVVSQANADHLRPIRRDYEVRRLELDQDYRARREANRYAYHRERDYLKAERARAQRIDCHDTRALRVRAINRELSAVTRNFNLKNRELSAWYHAEKKALRTSYEFAVRSSRRPVAVARPVITTPVVVESVPHAHPANCDCNICSPPTPVIERPIHPGYGVPRVNPAPVYDNYNSYDEYNYRPARHRGNPTAIDWASLVIGLLRN